jgi:Concanavalin A-like lectin/glucanases superfamily
MADAIARFRAAGERLCDFAAAAPSAGPHCNRPGERRASNLEIGEITIEVWGRVNGVSGPHGMRGATLLGTDYGKGGIGLLIAASGSPVLLHGATHTPLPADTPSGQWAQVVVTLKNGAARCYVNGQLACAVPAPRAPQSDHPPTYQLGTARFKEMDYVACDGLIGEIAIDQPKAARFYKLVVNRLAPGAMAVATHEIETYYGATVGSVAVLNGSPIQSEPCQLRVHVVSPDVALQGAVLRLVVPGGSVQGEQETALPAVERGSGATAEIAITPLHAGPLLACPMIPIRSILRGWTWTGVLPSTSRA